MSEAARIAQALGKARHSGEEWFCLCPAHPDETPSFSIRDKESGDGSIFKCHRDCSQESIVEALKARGLFGRPRVARKTQAGEWIYYDEAGNVVYRVQRFDMPDGKKDFLQSQPDGAGGWIYKMRGVKRVLYNLPKVLAAAASGKIVFIVEGEKCADSLNSRGFVATTNVGGAGKKWEQHYTDALRGASVVIIADNDETGLKHAEGIAAQLHAAGIRARLIVLPGVGKKGDIFDWFYIGKTEAELKELVKNTPLFEPRTEPASIEVDEQGQQIDEPTNLIVFPGAALDEMIDTETANAIRFVRDHKQDVRWTPQTEFLIWDGRRFKIDTTHQIIERAIVTAQNLYSEISEKPLELRPRMLKWARQCFQRSNLQNTVAIARSRIAAQFTDFDQDPWLLNCKNGVLDLRTGELKPHDRALNISKVTPINYDPSANAPKWYQFLKRAFDGDEEKIAFLQRVFGYMLTGITKEQKLFFFYGPGGTGKSTTLNIGHYMLGDYGVAVRAKMFMKKSTESQTDNIGLTVGARGVFVSEVDENDKWDSTLVKDFTGGDPVRGRYLFSESFEFKPVGKLLLRGNYKPYVAGNDDGFWRRMILVPFMVKIPAHETELFKELLAEIEGILAWSATGCEIWQTEKLSPPKSIEDETQQYRDEVDVIGEFIKQCCAVGDGPEYWEMCVDLFEAFRKFCEKGNFYFGNANRFGRAMKERGFKTDHKRLGDAYIGICLKGENRNA